MVGKCASVAPQAGATRLCGAVYRPAGGVWDHSRQCRAGLPIRADRCGTLALSGPADARVSVDRSRGRAEWTQRSALRAPQDGTAGSTSGSDTSISGTRASTVAFGPAGWLNTRDHAECEEAGGAARHGLTVGPGIPCGNLRSRAMVWAASFGKEVSGSQRAIGGPP